MATNTTPVFPPVRRDPRQVVNTLKRTISFNDADAAAASFANSLPAGAFIVGVFVEIVTPFNAATTNVLVVGTNATAYNNMVNAGDVNEAVAGVTRVDRGLGRGLTAAGDVAVFASYTQTGAAATAGQAIIVITYEAGGVS